MLIFISILLMSSLGLTSKQPAYFAIHAHTLSIHTTPQGPLADYYPLKIDSEAFLVLTPGLQLHLDLPFPLSPLTYLRSIINFNLDCALQISGYGGLAAMFGETGNPWISSTFGAGVGIYWRRGWFRYKVIPIPHWALILGKGDAVEWVPMPFLVYELRFHAPHSKIALVFDFMTAILLSVANFGVRFPLA
jgi:hypothetical protein